MKRVLIGVAFVTLPVIVVAISWAATNLNSSRSNIYREFPGTRLVTASTSLTRANDTQTVVLTPPTGDFVLTQFCSSSATGGILLSAARLGSIAQTGSGNLCYTFQPGFILPQGAALTCATGPLAETANHFCSIAGLVRE